MTFDEALRYLQSLQKFGIKLGNERTEALLSRLGNPQDKYRIAHVTGTKGKGSVTAMIAAILQAHGFRTGGYYSPYVYDIRERVQVDSVMIPRDDFARLAGEIAPIVDDIAATDLGQATEFEMKTALGFRYFAEQQVEFAAIEVGIGGRLDATNVVSPLVCVITNVGLDHTQILGDSVEKITVEKAGIIKPGVPVITAAVAPAFDVICRRAQEMGSPLCLARPAEAADADVGITWSGESPDLTVRTGSAVYSGLRLGLGGGFQSGNAACAISAVERMSESAGFAIDPEAVRAGLATVYLPGRLEIVRRRPTVILDGAHNGLAAAALADAIRRIPHRRLLLVIGMVSGHDPVHVLDHLGPLADRVYATQPSWDRALPAEQIAAAARQYDPSTETVVPPQAAVRAAVAEAGPDDLVLITGSFYVIGDVKAEEMSW